MRTRNLIMSRTLCGLALTFAGALAACSDTEEVSEHQAEIKISNQTKSALEAGQARNVLVAMNDSSADVGQVLSQAERSQFRAAQKSANLAGQAAVKGSLDGQVVKAYDHMPFMLVKIDSMGALEQLAQVAEINTIFDDEVHALVADTGPAMERLVSAVGSLKADQTVALLDTGVDFQSSFGCSEASAQCVVRSAQDIAVEDSALDASGHGTRFAKDIVKAVGGKLAALDVADEGDSALTSNILGGLEWSVSNEDSMKIAGVALAISQDSQLATMSAISRGMSAARMGGLKTVPLKTANNGGVAEAGSLSLAPHGITAAVSIDAGATYANAVTVSLTLTRPTASYTQMCISNTATCTTYVTYAATKSHQLSAAQGVKTVTVFYRLNAMDTNPVSVSDTIILDSVKPVPGVFGVVERFDPQGVANGFAFSMSGSSDSGSGLTDYRIAYSTTGAPSANCSVDFITVENIYLGWEAGLGVGATLINAVAGDVVNFRMCITDLAGNISPIDATAQVGVPGDAPLAGTTIPTSLVIADGEEFTDTASVSLGISGLDYVSTPDAVPAQMCISQSTTTKCTAWETYAATKTYALSGGSGLRTVYLWFRDVMGNVNLAPYADTIMLDTTAPTNGSVVYTTNGSLLVILWGGFSDPHSGIVGYKVNRADGNGSPPTNCTGDDVLAAAFETNGIVNQLLFYDPDTEPGMSYTYRVCAVNGVGKVSTGITVKGTAPDA